MTLIEKIIPALIVILKGWTVGVSIGIVLGMGVGVIAARWYGDHSTVSNAGLILICAVIGIAIGSYYGLAIAWSGYKKHNHLNLL